MIRAALLALLLLASGTACAYPAPDYAAAKRVSVRLEQHTARGRLTCSGWVKAHHAIVTDQHCLVMGTEGFTVNGRTVRILKVIPDGNDHAILLVDLYFKDVARMGPRPKLGEETFTLGNPDGEPDILLTGRVAGWRDTFPIPGFGTFRDVLILDSRDWHGCSGAAVFDRHGRVVSVINSIFPVPNDGQWRLTAAFGLRFTAEQWAEADAFDGVETPEMALERALRRALGEMGIH